MRKRKLGSTMSVLVVTLAIMLFLLPAFDPIIENQNSPPFANAGDDQTIQLGQEAAFDGSRSYDLDGDVSFSQPQKVNVELFDFNQDYPEIAVAKNGSIHVAWTDGSSGHTDIVYAMSSDNGSTFVGQKVVNDDNASAHQWYPEVSVASDGSIYIVWIDDRNLYLDKNGNTKNNEIYFSRSIDGGESFSQNVGINAKNGSVLRRQPSIAVDYNDNIHVVWYEIDEYNNTTWVTYARSTDGGGSFSIPINVTQAENCREPVLAISENGTIGVAWADRRTGDMDIYISISFDGGNTFQGEYRVNDETTGNQIRPAISASPEETFHIAWSDDRAQQRIIYYALTSDFGTTFLGNIPLSGLIAPDTTADHPTINALSEHVIHAVWIEENATESHVIHRRSVDGGSTFLSQQEVAWNPAEEKWGPSSALGHDGSIHVVWEDMIDYRGSIFYSRGNLALDFNWDFGDSSPHSHEVRPKHEYSAPGVYDVTLAVFDDQGAYDTDNCTITVLITNQSPIAEAGEDKVQDEGSITYFNGSQSNDPDGNIVVAYWDFDASVDSDGDGDYVNDVDAMGLTASHVYGDDGLFNVTLTVEDEHSATDSDNILVSVENLPPSVSGIQYHLNASFSFRITGEKWHNVEIHLHEDGTDIGYANISRYPGSPNEQMVHLADVSIDFSKTYSAVAYYTPEDDPINGQIWGATPAWVILEYEDGSEWIHHTFNVRHEDTWTWVMDDFSAYFLGHSITFMATASDPGSDDLTFTWDWGDGNTTEHTYYNDGLGPDPYPSPEVNPIAVTDHAEYEYCCSGSYDITLSVRDDDQGYVSIVFTFST